MWNDANVALLRQWWDEGLYASQIALKFGITRNAVIGKAFRLGLAKRKEAPSGRPRSARPLTAAAIERIQRKNQPKRRRQRHKETAQPERATVVHLHDDAIPLEQRRTLDTLGANECHFPVGDPATQEFFYCGAPTDSEHAYCPDHYRRMYTPPPPRRPRQRVESIQIGRRRA